MMQIYAYNLCPICNRWQYVPAESQKLHQERVLSHVRFFVNTKNRPPTAHELHLLIDRCLAFPYDGSFCLHSVRRFLMELTYDIGPIIRDNGLIPMSLMNDYMLRPAESGGNLIREAVNAAALLKTNKPSGPIEKAVTKIAGNQPNRRRIHWEE